MSSTTRTFGWILAAVLAVAYLATMTATGALPRSRQLIEFHAAGLLDAEPAAVSRVELSADGQDFKFVRRDGQWVQSGSDKVLSLQQASTLERAVKFMHTSAPVRVFAEADFKNGDMSQYGLDSPRYSIVLAGEQGELMRARFGAMNSSGMLQYMQVKGRTELYLVSRFVGGEWESVESALAPQQQ